MYSSASSVSYWRWCVSAQAQKKEKKRLKKEERHREAGGDGRDGSPSSGSDAEKKRGSAELAGDQSREAGALEQLRQQALERVIQPAT